jgi:RND family efflux transporter MFP subunit
MAKIFTKDNRQLVLVIFIVVAAVVLSRIISNTRTLPQAMVAAAPLSVTVATIQAGSHPVEIRTTGRVVPRGTVSITPQVSGRVEWVSDSFYGGGFLEGDQVLFRIEAADYENNVARQRAEVAKAQTDLALEQAEAHAAVAEWQALNEGVALPPLVSRTPQIAQADAELAAALARLAQAELDLSRTQYRLPFDGRVITSSLEVGEYVLAGQRYGEIYNQDSLEVVLSLPQGDLAWISGSTEIGITITFEEPGTEQVSRSITGKILRRGAELNDTTRFQEIIVKPIGDGSLIPGMLTEVVLSSAPVANTWQLPVTAMQAEQVIWLVNEDSTLRRVEPEILATLPDTVIARLPISDTSARVVNMVLGGGIEGTKVAPLEAEENER